MGLPGGQRRMQSLVDEHYQPLYRYAYRLSGSTADAEDLTQEAFCKAQMKLGQLKDWEKARSWLCTILRNGYLRCLRDEKRWTTGNMEHVPAADEHSGGRLPEIDQTRLQETLSDMPEAFRTPVVLFYFEKHSYREIADMMGVPLGTVMSRLSRGKQFLRNRLLGVSARAGARRQTSGL